MDEQLLLLINREWTGPVLDRAMATITSLDVWMPFMVLGVLLALWRGSFKVRAFIVTAGLLLAVNDGLVSKTLKRVVDRPRPHQSHNDVRVIELAKAKPRILAVGKPLKIKRSETQFGEIEGRSFPSSHTMNTFAVALAGLVFFGARAWWLLVIALTVGYSRIYTGAHWPSDVLTSLFLCAGVTLPLLALVNPLWQKVAARFCPRLLAQHPTIL